MLVEFTLLTNNQTTSKTLGNREFVSVVGAGLTMTLPASPEAGWEVASWYCNNICRYCDCKKLTEYYES
jgi:coproporphyrinogen III oxidase-like Fe-S oxidoreductase